MDQASISLAATLHALATRQDGITNNLANVSSTAFKRRSGVIEPFASHLRKKALASLVGYREYNDLSQGDIAFNGNPMNIALTGEGFLRIRHPKDPALHYYTRVGDLAKTPNGFLATPDGFLVLGPQGQPLDLGAETRFRFQTTGEILSDETGGELGTIGLVRFENPEKLLPIGMGFFKESTESGPPVPDRFTRIDQGALERANVEPIQELISMISTQRHFSTITKAMGALQGTRSLLLQLARG